MINPFNKSVQLLLRHWATFTVCIVCCLFSLYTSNRSFVAGYTLSLILIYLYSINNQFNKFKIILWAAFFIGILLSLAVFIDPDSSKGRILIYKISLSIWQDHFISGIGQNRFEAVYNLYQSDYFRSGINSTKELLLADNTYYAFNDYFQFIIEYGVTGIILLLVLFLMIVELVYFLIRYHRNELKSIIFFTSQITAISFAALFTHIFDIPLARCILISSISMLLLMVYSVELYRRHFLSLLILVHILMISCSNWKYIIYNQSFKDWKEADLLSKTGAKKKSLQLYKKAYINLHQNYEFIFSYGNTLQELEHFDLALEMYNKASFLQISNRLLDKIAGCHQSLGNINQAEVFYLRSIFTVPNRFTNRHHLFNLYYSTGQLEKASICGNSILNLPTKVKSAKIDEIRSDVFRKMKKILIDRVRVIVVNLQNIYPYEK